MRIHFLCGVLLLGASALVSCSGGASESFDSEADSAAMRYDLILNELKGPVKKCTKTTYYDVNSVDGRLVIDSVCKNVVSTTARFDSDGNYMAKEDEKIKRDSLGRIVRWSDSRPNAKKVPLGFATDTLGYRYEGKNLMITDGMGDYAVLVYDDDHKIVGQYTVPRLGNTRTAAFNVYKKTDKHGNWTERVTIWSTEGSDSQVPAVHYSIDRREIEYY